MKQKPYLNPINLVSIFLAGAVLAFSLSSNTVPLEAPSGGHLPNTEAASAQAGPTSPQSQRALLSINSVAKISPLSPSPSGDHPNYTYIALMTTPTGPLYGSEPFLSRINTNAGWADVASNSASPIIAVVDTGIALNHEDFAGRLVPGWDFVNNDSSPQAGASNPNGSAVFHGTMTSGLAALLNPRAKIMPLQALSDDGVGSTNTVAAAVRYAADNGANIISLSLGSSADDSYLHQQIDYAISKGVLVVAAAGNNGCNCMMYPANYPEVLAVGASDSQDNRASFSSYGPNLDLVAPGTAGDVCSAFYTSTNATNAYSCSYSGTSFATPIVAGLASLLINQAPPATPDNLIRFVDQGAMVLAAMNGQSPSLQYGYGLANLANSVVVSSLAPPRGQIINKHTTSLSAPDLVGGPSMETACLGVPSSTCSVRLTGPGGSSISLGSKSVDANGAADFIWSAQTLGLTTGQWQITETLSAFGQSASTYSDSFTVSP